jgi:hypothetical protein
MSSCTNFWQTRLPHGFEPSLKMSFFPDRVVSDHMPGAKFP